MSTNNTQELWAQLGDFKPQLQSHIQISQQVFRGEQWYLLKDSAQGKFSRFNAISYRIIAAMDGSRSNAQILSLLQGQQDTEAGTQENIILLVQRLNALNLLKKSAQNESSQLAQQAKADKRKKTLQKISNPLAIKLPLLDPDAQLDCIAPKLKFLYQRSVAYLIFALIATALYLSILNSHRIEAALGDHILQPSNLVAMAILYVLLKALHEFAHALTVKVWGGEVHEVGISLLVLAPIPYVDATAAWQFKDKSKRVIVSAMGIIAELVVASVAIFIWLAAEPGLLKSTCLNLAVIASISTVAFNANPLLKFDGYYVLQDLIEIPNLYAKSKQYFLYLLQRYLLGAQLEHSPSQDSNERMWLLLYAVAAFFYRLFLMLVITLYLVNTFLIVGIILAMWSVYSQIIKPLISSYQYLCSNDDISENRGKAKLIATGLVASLFAFSVLMPMPYSTRTQGVVWVSEQAEVFSTQAGFISEILVASGTAVKPGTALIKLHAPDNLLELQKLEAKRASLLAEQQAEFIESSGRTRLTQDSLAMLDGAIAEKQKDQSELIVRSKVHGTFISPDLASSRGKHIKKGGFIGYVFAPDNLLVKSIFSQTDIGKLRQGVDTVEIRLAESLGTPINARLIRETPSGSHQLPSKALGAAGGGNIAVASNAQQQTTATEKYFNIEFALDNSLPGSRVGGVAYVHVKHKSVPLAKQLGDVFRQSFLHKLNI